MIRVECAACGATFQAKDELAGRQGKCPKCKAGITVPQAAAAPATPAVAPAAAPRSQASRASAAPSRGAKAGGARRRPAGRSSKGGMGAVVVVVVLAALVAAAGYFLSGDSVGVRELQQAIEAKTVREFDRAITLLESIPESSTVYKAAQDELIDILARKSADDDRDQAKKAARLYDNIKVVEKSYVKGPGPESPNYATNARYLLKRCVDFVTLYPNDPRAAELGQYGFIYANVASLNTPPTEGDVDAELRFRFVGHAFALSASAIDEYASTAGADPDAVRRLRDRVQSASLDYWKTLKSQLGSEGALTPGEEDWQRIANSCRRYLDSIEGVPGVTPAIDAKTLYARAQEG